MTRLAPTPNMPPMTRIRLVLHQPPVGIQAVYLLTRARIGLPETHIGWPMSQSSTCALGHLAPRVPATRISAVKLLPGKRGQHRPPSPCLHANETQGDKARPVNPRRWHRLGRLLTGPTPVMLGALTPWEGLGAESCGETQVAVHHATNRPAIT